MGPREVVGPVGVEDVPVVLDLVEEVVDEIAGAIDLVVQQQTDEDEVAVPPVHLVEAAAGNHVRLRQIEEAVALEP